MSITETPTRISGGDGSLRRVVQSLIDSESRAPVGLEKRGTNNVVWNELKELGYSMSAEEFADTDPTDPRFCRFRPARFGNVVFCSDVGFGQFEQEVGRITERIRSWPKLFRSILPVLGSLRSLQRLDNLDILNIYSTAPNIGPYRVFPNQHLESNTLTHAWIEGDSHSQKMGRLYLTLLYWRLGKIPSQNILRTTKSNVFYQDFNNGELWIDGDYLSTEQSGKFVIERVNIPISITAIR